MSLRPFWLALLIISLCFVHKIIGFSLKYLLSSCSYALILYFVSTQIRLNHHEVIMKHCFITKNHSPNDIVRQHNKYTFKIIIIMLSCLDSRNHHILKLEKQCIFNQQFYADGHDLECILKIESLFLKKKKKSNSEFTYS